MLHFFGGFVGFVPAVMYLLVVLWSMSHAIRTFYDGGNLCLVDVEIDLDLRNLVEFL
jgi:hypothetical protein